MHHLPRKLSSDELATLFEGRTRFVERLAEQTDPLGAARGLLATLPEDEQLEALNAHPRIGAARLSRTSAREQGDPDDPAVLAELGRLNHAYEARFGFRFVVFVNRRSRSDIVRELERRLTRTRGEEIQKALDDLCAIALDRYRTAIRRAP